MQIMHAIYIYNINWKVIKIILIEDFKRGIIKI